MKQNSEFLGKMGEFDEELPKLTQYWDNKSVAPAVTKKIQKVKRCDKWDNQFKLTSIGKIVDNNKSGKKGGGKRFKITI